MKLHEPITRDDLTQYVDAYGHLRRFDIPCHCEHCRKCLADKHGICLCGFMVPGVAV